MLQSQIPAIPQRPRAKDDHIDTDGFSGDSDSNDSGDEQQVSLKTLPKSPPSQESAVSEVVSPKLESIEPVIPKRPVRTKSSSSGIESSLANEETASPVPTIPARPRKAQKQVQEENQTDSKTLDTSSQVDEKDEAPHSDELISPIPEDNTEPKSEGTLNSQLNDPDSTLANLDGEKTPGNSNTKITFKNDEEDPLRVDSDVSSFTDDVETVLQEKEDEELNERLQNDKTAGLESESTGVLKENDSEVAIKEATVANDADLINELGNSIGESQTVKEEIPEAESEGSHDTKEIPSDGDVREPETASKETIAKDAELSTLQSGLTEATINSEKPGDVVPENESAFSDLKKPAIPIRPKKKPSLPPVAKEEDDKPSTLDSSKPKAPPPKPKKLSSKISAFQQMFSQDSNPPKPDYTPHSKRTDGAFKSGSNKLSNEKLKFAETLPGMMGRGIALPGLANPGLFNKASKEAADSVEENDASHSLVEKEQPRRPKGPKGRRLPKSLKDPVNIEVESKFKIVTHELWNVKFSNTRADIEEVDNEGDDVHVEPSVESEVFEKEEPSSGAEELIDEKAIFESTEHIPKNIPVIASGKTSPVETKEETDENNEAEKEDILEVPCGDDVPSAILTQNEEVVDKILGEHAVSSEKLEIHSENVHSSPNIMKSTDGLPSNTQVQELDEIEPSEDKRVSSIIAEGLEDNEEKVESVLSTDDDESEEVIPIDVTKE